MADAYDNAAKSSDAAARAALAAIAQAGTAGKQAFDQGQAQIQAAQQAATASALGKANLVGGPEAFAPSFQQTVAKPYTAAGAALGSLGQSFQQGLASQNLMNRNYMDQVRAAVPLERAMTYRDIAAAGAKRQDDLSNSEAKVQYTGAAQNEIDRIKAENTAKFHEVNRRENDALKRIKGASNNPQLARLEKDAAFWRSEIARLSGNKRAGVTLPIGLPMMTSTGSVSKGKSVIGGGSLSADDQRRLLRAQQGLANVQNKIAPLRSETERIKQAATAEAAALSKEVAKARGAQAPLLSETAAQKAIAAGLDPDRARGLFPSSLDTKAYAEAHPKTASFAKEFKIPVMQAAELRPEYENALSEIKSSARQLIDAKGDPVDPITVAAGIEAQYPDAPEIGRRLAQEYTRQYNATLTARTKQVKGSASQKAIKEEQARAKKAKK